MKIGKFEDLSRSLSGLTDLKICPDRYLGIEEFEGFVPIASDIEGFKQMLIHAG